MMKTLLGSATRLQVEALLTKPEGSYLFTGIPHTGKATAAYECAELICDVGRHPDARAQITHIRPDEKGSIKIATIHTLIQELTLKAAQHNRRRVVIFDTADSMTTEAQNALLKTLEEPPQGVTIILTSAEKSRLLPTIRSRCREIQFTPPPEDAAQALVGDEGAFRAAGGVIGQAVSYRDDEERREAVQELHGVFHSLMSSSTFEALTHAQRLHGHSDPERVIDELVAYIKQLPAGTDDDLALRHTWMKRAEWTMRLLANNVGKKFAFDSLVLETGGVR